MAEQIEVRTGAYPEKTPDGKDVVYVAMPSIETTDAWAKDQREQREARNRDLAIGARVQALQHARDFTSYWRATGDKPEPQTTDERIAEVLAAAEQFEAYLLKD